jgi:hypothetical protein
MISQVVHIPYLEEEPRCISCIKASAIASIVEVGDQPSMSEDSSELDNGVLGFIKESCGQEEALKRDKGISAPASCVASREMRKTCGHCVLVIIELGRRDSTPHLNDS